MQIKNLFDSAKDINRTIEKVITYQAAQEERLKAEITEYIVTDHIEDQFESLLTKMQMALGEVGVNGGGVNDKVFVRGFGIAKLSFRIYNRWGQLVFQTADQATGWDGRFKGALQPMDAYAYQLDVQFSDGTRATKKGDITLIR